MKYLHILDFVAHILTLPALFFKSFSYPVFFLQISYLTRTCSRNFYLLLAFVLQILSIHAHVDEILILRALFPLMAFPLMDFQLMEFSLMEYPLMGLSDQEISFMEFPSIITFSKS